MLKQKVRH